MGDVLVQADRGNNVMGHSEAMYAIQEINPTLEQKQAKYKFDRNVLTKSYDNGKIKKRNFKEQAITTERTSIMYQPQWHWYGFLTGMLNDMRKKNVGLCKSTDNIIHNFVLVLHEACIMTDSGKNVIIIGSTDGKYHEKILADR